MKRFEPPVPLPLKKPQKGNPPLQLRNAWEQTPSMSLQPPAGREVSREDLRSTHGPHRDPYDRATRGHQYVEVIGKGDEQCHDVRAMVTRAGESQVKRFAEHDGIDCNARLPDGLFSTFCRMDASAEALFEKAQKSLLVSTRVRGHIVRVARTIADLESCERIAERHIGQAVGYRGERLARHRDDQ